MAEPTRNKRRYGLPWAGYQSSAAPHLCPPDKATSDGPSSTTRRSYNFLYNPLEEKFYRRQGSAYVGGATGILENGTGELTVGRARQLISLRSASLLDGYPTHAVLWTEEGNNKGCIYLRSTNTNINPFVARNYVLGQEFHPALYPFTPTTAGYMKMMPYMRTTDGKLSRMVALLDRAVLTPGSRRILEVGDQLLMPSLKGTPLRWNKKYNEDDTDTADILRLWHTGSPSPLGLPLVDDNGSIVSTGSWHEGDQFYVSVAYRMSDGSVTMPIIPRDRNADINYIGNNNMSGFGKVTLLRSGGFTDRYLSLDWTNIPIGPEGTEGRYLLRSPKKEGLNDGNVTGPDPSPLDLRITAYLPNNTQTSYVDSNGNDLSLTTDPLLVRFDHIMPPPARYISTFDSRIMVGYTNPHPVAFYLCPQVNLTDNDDGIDTLVYEYVLNAGVLTLFKAGAFINITADKTKTIQQVVDKINNTISTDASGKWFACVAPGADPTAYCSEGATAAVNNNLTGTLGFDLGDAQYAATGRMRCYGSSYPGCVFYSTTYLANYPTQKRRLFFTMAGPGMPSNAANSWAAGNYRTAPESWGDFMGSAPLRAGEVVCFSKAIATLENRKGGTSGLDEDYQLYVLNYGRGCIAWDSVAEFNGAVGYLTADGYVVTDGRDEVIISRDVWNSGTRTGEWDYEILQSAAAAAADTDLSHFHAKVMGGKLCITYRLTSGVSFPNRMLIYDFTGSAQYSGLRGVLNPNGTPWGWSTPLKPNTALGGGGGQTWSVMGEVTNASGINRYAVDEDTTHTSMTSNGTIFQIETGTQDNASAIDAELWTARDMADHLKNKSLQEVMLLYKKNGTGLTLVGYRDGLGTTADSTLTIPTTSSNNFSSLLLPMPQLMRSGAKTIEFKIADDGSGSDAPQVWGIEADLLLLDSYT